MLWVGVAWDEYSVAKQGCREAKQNTLCLQRVLMAPGQGFEPRLLGPEPSVLPLDDPGMWVEDTKKVGDSSTGQEKSQRLAGGGSVESE